MDSATRFFVAAFACSFLIVAPASAQLTLTNNSGQATAETQYGAGSFLSPQTVTTSFGPDGGVALSHLDLRNFGQVRAVQTGIGLNAVSVDARLGDIPSFYWSGQTSYDVEVKNTGFSTSSVDFEFHLNGGRLGLYDPTGLFNGLAASVDVSIFAISPGFSGFLWSWTLTLRGSQGQVTPSVDFLIDPLGFGVPDLGALTIANGEAFIDIAAFTAAVDLGPLAAGHTAFVTYDMSAAVFGLGFNATGGVARLGDPFSASGDYGAGIRIGAVPAAVSEPPVFALLFGGILLFAIRGNARGSRADRA
jgi:hypothetical protein